MVARAQFRIGQPIKSFENVTKSYEVLIQPEAQSQFRQIWLPVQQGFRLVEISPGQGINQITIPNQPQIINLTNQNQPQIVTLPGHTVWNKGAMMPNQLNRSVISGVTSGGTSGGTSGSVVSNSVDVKTEIGADDIVSLMENDSQEGFQIASA